MRRVTVVCGLIFGVVMAVIAPFFPLLYNTTDYIRHLATNFILICAFMMPFCSYTHASYFIMRSGGNAFLTVLFDSVYTWVLVVPLAFCLSRFTSMSVTWILFLVHAMEIVQNISEANDTTYTYTVKPITRGNGQWDSKWNLFPFSQTEIMKSGNAIIQNEGW